MRKILIFFTSECGTVTADWAVLGAVAMFCAIATVSVIKDGAVSIGPKVSSSIALHLD
ncbi:MAG: hypothetical protein AAGK37_22410 [Pseudomonadota bacterium]